MYTHHTQVHNLCFRERILGKTFLAAVGRTTAVDVKYDTRAERARENANIVLAGTLHTLNVGNLASFLDMHLTIAGHRMEKKTRARERISCVPNSCVIRTDCDCWRGFEPHKQYYHITTSLRRLSDYRNPIHMKSQKSSIRSCGGSSAPLSVADRAHNFWILAHVTHCAAEGFVVCTVVGKHAQSFVCVSQLEFHLRRDRNTELVAVNHLPQRSRSGQFSVTGRTNIHNIWP